MSLLERIDQDLKQALLQGKKEDVTTYRGLKSVIQNEAITKRAKNAELTEDDIVNILTKEAKKRQESADLFVQGGAQERADNELREKVLIEGYLPKQMDDAELETLVEEVIAGMGQVTPAQMGQIIGAVKAKAGSTADGGRIATIVKGKLTT